MLRFLCLVLVFVSTVVTDPQKCSISDNKEIRWIGSGSIEWPSPITKNMYKSSGRYIPENIIAARLAIYKDDIFLAFPRYKLGTPMTLAKLNLKGKQCQVSLSGFPSLALQEEGNCAALQSVIDIFLDPYGILWVLDIGVTNYLEEGETTKCPAKVLGISVKTGKVVKTIEIGSLTNEISRLQYMVVDYTRDGRAYVYVSDAANRGILVFDVTSGRGYRMVLPKAVSLGSTNRDVLYLALVHQPGDNQNRLVFSYLSSKHLFSIKTVHLQKGSARGKVEEIAIKDRFIFLGTDNGSEVYFRQEDEPDVYAWDIFNATKPVRKIYRGNGNALPTQLVADKKGHIRLFESNFPEYFHGSHTTGVNHAIKLIA